MKGFAIYSNPMWGDNDNAVYCQPLMCAKYRLQMSSSSSTVCALEGEAPDNKELTKATCSPDDEYDFEIGALIALMKMCGVDKVKKAAKETFFEVAENAVNEYEEEIERLKEENAELIDTNNALADARDYFIKESAQRLRKYVALKAENEKLKKEKEQIIAAKNVLYNKLEEENKKLKLDNEKLQKGRLVWMTSQPERLSFHANYIDTDALEALRGSKCPSWLDGKKWNYISIDEFAFKPASKREKMWDDILKEGRTPVYVKREDIHDFLEECQVVGIKWSSGKSPLETIPFHMSEGCDGVYFFIMTTLDISKTLSTAKRGIKEFRHVMSWWCTACPDEVEAAIHYIRPMRWDLFEKGRLVVKLDNHNYREFCTKCESKIGRKPRYVYNYAPFTVYYKDGVFHSRPYDEKVPYKYKVVDWEDVR